MWFSAIPPRPLLKKQGGFWVVGYEYFSASRHTTRDDALAAYDACPPWVPSFDDLKKVAKERNKVSA
jgi:hypothetical protein